MILLALVASLYVGWNIGANDTANCIGPTVGSGIVGYRQAVVLTALFVALGAMVGGGKVMETVGNGIITEKVPPGAILIGLIFAGLFVTLATIWRVPVSTAQSAVGAIAGIGWALGKEVSHGKLIHIVGSWVICPVLTMIMSYLVYIGLAALLSRFRNRTRVNTIAGGLMVATSCYVAYSLGANNVGNAVGFVNNLGYFDVHWLTVLGGAAIAIGALTFGKGVTMTVGKSITPLNVPGALSAQFCAAFGIHLFAELGIPVSTSQAIVGAVLGVGLVKGSRGVSKGTLINIAVGWVATPVLAATASFLVCKLVF